MTAPLTRRAALRGGVVVLLSGVAGFALARRSDAAHGSGSAAAANGYGPGTATGTRLARLSDVPDGGGLVLPGPHVLLVRQAGTVHALSATCTHQGCTVAGVADGVVPCPCHGSRFDARTGAVLRGPATRPLAAVPVVVRDGSVFRAGGG